MLNGICKGNNISVYPASRVILNVVKDPAQGLSKAHCEILRYAQNDTIVVKKSIWVNIYIIAFVNIKIL